MATHNMCDDITHRTKSYEMRTLRTINYIRKTFLIYGQHNLIYVVFYNHLYA